ncbi:MAG TPA: hypothetical protein VLR91_04105, partial [Thermodesulfobacteriota bacterium]|nr:hypothetical protein [Thermodesulfobacteriota bacterium]
MIKHHPSGNAQALPRTKARRGGFFSKKTKRIQGPSIPSRRRILFQARRMDKFMGPNRKRLLPDLNKRFSKEVLE